MPVLSEAFLSFVGGHFMAFSFLSARHNYSVKLLLLICYCIFLNSVNFSINLVLYFFIGHKSTIFFQTVNSTLFISLFFVNISQKQVAVLERRVYLQNPLKAVHSLI